MNWTFRTKLTSVVFALILTSVGGTSYFILKLYQRDKLSGILEAELANTSQAAARLDNLISLADVIALDRVKTSRELIFLFDDPCTKGPNYVGVTSSLYQPELDDLELTTKTWTESLDLFRACSKAANPLEKTKATRSVTIVPSKAQMMLPYITTLLTGPNGTRYAMLSMDGFTTSAANTLFLVDAHGNLLWSADGDSYVKSALADTGITQARLAEIAQEGIGSKAPRILDAGTNGLLSYAKVGTEWLMVSLAYKPTALQPVSYAITQSLFLIGGFIFLCLFIGKNMAILLTRPLNDLRLSAERIGQGDFETRFQVKGKDEISTVKSAFNTMAERIVKLLNETKVKAEMESELKLAQQVQRMLLPKPSLQSKHVHVYSYVKSATQCGGDWWGYLEVPQKDGRTLFVVIIGDVVGHGTASALITATARGGLSVLNSWTETAPELAKDPRDILKHFNRTVFDAAKGALTMTCFAAVLDPVDQTLVCANAGHNLPYMVVPNDDNTNVQLKVLGKSGVPLGYGADTPYEDIETHPWTVGSQLFLYTDGLTENMVGDDNLFDRRQLKKALKSFGTSRGKDLLNRVLSEREKCVKDLPPADDVTAVVCEARGLQA